MAQRQREREEKYDVGSRFGIPDLADLVPAGGRIEHGHVHLDSSYFDTAERDLLAHGVTLRRRSGDHDTGWQLKVPEGKARTEIRLPADHASVPDDLVALVRGVSQGRPLVEIARVRTERTVQRIHGSDDATLIEVADDEVHAAALGEDALLTRWREIEVELGPGGKAQLNKVGKRLVRAGARPSNSSSKLARALDMAGNGRRPTPVSSVVTDYLRGQHAELVAGDVALRQGRDAIHATRVATRRIRAILRVFGPLFDQRRSTRLDSELSWYAGLLGNVRDRQVQRTRFAAALHELPDDMVVDSVADDIDEWLRTEQDGYSRELRAALDSTRYVQLLSDVRAWAQAPPFIEGACAPPSVLKRLVRKARRTADKRLSRAAAAVQSGDDEPHVDAALHRARKAAKRARYAVELTAPIGKHPKKIIKRYRARQDLLGEHQDAVVAGHLLRDHASRGVTPPPFTYGLLYTREESIAQKTRDKAVKSAR